MATKKRLIDANEAIERAKASDKIVGSSIWETGEVVEFLEDCPIVGAVEVVHGRWLEWYPPMHMILTGEDMLYRCSACDAKYADIEGYKYCPYCGAKMDGDGNG